MNDHPRNLSDSDPPSVSVTEPGAVAAWQAPLLDVLAVLARRRLLIIAIVTAGAVAGTLQYLRTPSFYRASAVAVLLPREKPAVDMAVSSATVETTEDGAKRANSGSLMLPPQTDLYVALLGSRSVLESLAGQFGDRLARLRELKANDRSDEIVMRLKDMVSVAGTDEGLLTFTVTADDPVLASDLANAMVQEGQRASKAIERQLLVQQAGYLEYAVRASAERLTDAESRLKSFCERHRLIDPNLQATDSLRQIRELDAVRERRAIELARRRLSHTDADPGVRALQHEIELTDQRLVALHAEITSGIGDEEYGRLLVEFAVHADRGVPHPRRAAGGQHRRRSSRRPGAHPGRAEPQEDLRPRRRRGDVRRRRTLPGARAGPPGPPRSGAREPSRRGARRHPVAGPAPAGAAGGRPEELRWTPPRRSRIRHCGCGPRGRGSTCSSGPRS
jgi:hypothetical protein